MWYKETGIAQIISNPEICNDISELACELISNPVWSDNDINVADVIFEICNEAYNNTSADVTVLDDGVYDQLLVIYKSYNPYYRVGSRPTEFREIPQNEFLDKKVMCVKISDKDKDRLYLKDIWGQHIVNPDPSVKTLLPEGDPISKRLINTRHKYPELIEVCVIK